ncbi:hypothetical protein [Nonlabens ponticola]|uniref:DUF4870 domain-containing protein n=1 Tax=Nonlabens ponticola TaxID=2496866 RepID=A0A3S9MZ18_9FLAO|nr:hypothetical protein [Nonlabens ponticola]AZQ44501.1 hypothetical protein EJ995_09695 [Nonlabens ponticola]
MTNQTDGKLLALLAYASALFLYLHLVIFLAFLGTFILLNMGRNREFVAFHHRQMFGIGLIAILVNSLANVVPNGWIALLFITGVVMIAAIGFLAAIKNLKTPLPYIGEKFQQWFKFIQ